MLAVLIALLLMLFAPGFATQDEEPGPRFVTVDVYIDTGDERLAAWQFELACDEEQAKIAGVESGADKFQQDPPYYDPEARETGRVIVGAFTLRPDAPKGKVHVARLHMMEEGPVVPEYGPKLIAAAAPGGKRIKVTIETVRRGGSDED
jgi:hypothetical protein